MKIIAKSRDGLAFLVQVKNDPDRPCVLTKVRAAEEILLSISMPRPLHEWEGEMWDWITDAAEAEAVSSQSELRSSLFSSHVLAATLEALELTPYTGNWEKKPTAIQR